MIAHVIFVQKMIIREDDCDNFKYFFNYDKLPPYIHNILLITKIQRYFPAEKKNYSFLYKFLPLEKNLNA